MEKKEYISPVMTVVNLNPVGMLALSTNEASAQQLRGMDTKDDGDYDLWDEE